MELNENEVTEITASVQQALALKASPAKNLRAMISQEINRLVTQDFNLLVTTLYLLDISEKN